MPISMFQVSVPRFIHILESLRSILDKAMAYEEAKKRDPSVLPNARIYPDMLPLTAQVPIASDSAKGAADAQRLASASGATDAGMDVGGRSDSP